MNQLPSLPGLASLHNQFPNTSPCQDALVPAVLHTPRASPPAELLPRAFCELLGDPSPQGMPQIRVGQQPAGAVRRWERGGERLHGLQALPSQLPPVIQRQGSRVLRRIRRT